MLGARAFYRSSKGGLCGLLVLGGGRREASERDGAGWIGVVTDVRESGRIPAPLAG